MQTSIYSRYFKKMQDNKTTSLIVVCIIIAGLFFSLYKYNQVPACINADEAAFGYNAYSILKTARDEYGHFMPLRFVSFLDFKLPLYTYLSVPFVGLFGLNDYSTRALNILVAFSLLVATYKLSCNLFGDKKTALIITLFISMSPWIYILTRHAHEGPLSVLFVLLSLNSLLFFIKKSSLKDFFLANIFILGSVFSYHSARMFLVLIIVIQVVYLILSRKKHTRNQNLIYMLSIIIVFTFSFGTDARYGVNRVTQLLFLKNEGFALRVAEYRSEHNVRLIHNKATEAVRDITYRYMSQISPEFLVIHGDTNWRFGFQNLGLITPIEYGLIFVGLYYLFKNQERYRWVVLFFLLVSPLPNAFTWQDASIIRTYIFVFPLMMIVGYGVRWSLKDASKIQKLYVIPVVGILILTYLYFRYGSWDIYFNHYSKRAVVTRAWQCGYKELVDYIRINYDKYDQFVITDKHGQPYIYLLYYLKYEPRKYQSQAKISAPDKYGFGQIKSFDKFIFSFVFDTTANNKVYIGYPEDFNGLEIDEARVKKIQIGTEEIFWIYET